MIVSNNIDKVEVLLRKYNIFLSKSYAYRDEDDKVKVNIVMKCCSSKFRKVFGDISILKLYCQTVLGINLYLSIKPHEYAIFIDLLEVGFV